MDAEMFGPYRVVASLGRGGMGEVHRAEDTRRDRVVALKRLHRALGTSEDFRERFRRESQLAARLSSPHVIPIHDWGEIDDRLFIDMRLAEGVDLAELLRTRGALGPERSADLVRQIASALDDAHRAGLVHRDVKPSNVLVTDQRGHDFAYLVDFGIVRALDDSGVSLTGTGSAVGTLAYMAPELFEGRRADARSDVYALACVLHETLTGGAPFGQSSAPALMHGHLNVPPPRPSEHIAGVPRELDDVVVRGMAKDPAERYASPGELADAALRASRAAPGSGTTTITGPPGGGSGGGGFGGAPTYIPWGGGPPPGHPPSTPPPSSTPPGGPQPWTPGPPPAGWPDPADTAGRPNRRGTWVAVAVALVLVVAVIVTLVLVNRDSGSGGTVAGGVTPAAAGGVLAGQTYTVGGKNFDEQLVLCKMTIAVLQARGATASDRCNISGSAAARQALLAGQIDVAWEYTGTGWITNLRNSTPIPDAARQYQAVRDADAANGVSWLAPTPFNNTYGIAATSDVLARYNLRTLSDLARLNNGGTPVSLCVESEFEARDDGLPGMVRAYGFSPSPTPTALDTGAIYQAAANGNPCTFGEIFTTDGRLPGLDLVPLVDDRNYFPFYNASPVVRTSVLQRQPALRTVLDEISPRLTQDVMLDLNGQVSSQGQDPAVVATRWLRQQGLIS
ncbi:glycine betaine ABC transporter substrate-binding protein [Actinomycetospora sp. CA-101289]|uniref:glycine betaine ABC transporter substrate-binding protein n=1 Tax=Actinomycetospora sp. CA-101289 TaxID=3239893 RepID=UPI003D98D3C9